MAERTLRFLGGAGTVTGSKTLLDAGSTGILVDCGLFQGIKRRRRRNWDPLPVDPAGLDHVLLTHGHLDHVGYLPRLVKQGFDGQIHGSKPTLDVARVILRDSAKIQEEDAAHANREGYTRHDPAEPLYTREDAEETFPLFEGHPPGEERSLGEDVTFTLRPNGHILGSTLIEVDAAGTHLVFSGDLGRPEPLIHPVPESPSALDTLVLESTYGDRRHPETDPAEELEEAVRSTVEKGGHLVVPSFALGRAQQLMLLFNRMRQQGRIPDCPVYLDSPMGVNITDLYRRHERWHRLSPTECADFYRRVELIEDFQRTRRVLDGGSTKIIIAGSGMLTGGRVLFYLERLLGDPSTTVLLTGYQAEGTRGRLLRDGAHELKFHGDYYPVRADVREITGLSAHADQVELLGWLSELPEAPDRVILNHGEPGATQALRVNITDRFGWNCETAAHDDVFSLEAS